MGQTDRQTDRQTEAHRYTDTQTHRDFVDKSNFRKKVHAGLQPYTAGLVSSTDLLVLVSDFKVYCRLRKAKGICMEPLSMECFSEECMSLGILTKAKMLCLIHTHSPRAHRIQLRQLCMTADISGKVRVPVCVSVCKCRNYSP